MYELLVAFLILIGCFQYLCLQAHRNEMLQKWETESPTKSNMAGGFTNVVVQGKNLCKCPLKILLTLRQKCT